METPWQNALWRQFGAAIDMLDNAVVACPDALWDERIWPDPPDDPEGARSGLFWAVTYHTLFWLEAYLSGSVEDYAPPAPFVLEEGDRAAMRAAPYSKEQLRG
ncbi:MAG TPA: DinB family protein, partial [Ktedonobacterales bacterium]|nr:DinB family protein [Ktedonobacterales bacterium]